MTANSPSDKALTLQDVAERLNVSLPTIYRRMHQDPTFVTFKVGHRRRMLESQFHRWVREQEEKARAA